MLEDTWPLDLITSNERQPLEVFAPTAFAAQVLLADHLEDVVVFRNGEQALGISREDCLPDWVSDCLEHAEGSEGRLRFEVAEKGREHLESVLLKANVEFTTAHKASRRRPRPRRRDLDLAARGPRRPRAYASSRDLDQSWV